MVKMDQVNSWGLPGPTLSPHSANLSTGAFSTMHQDGVEIQGPVSRQSLPYDSEQKGGIKQLIIVTMRVSVASVLKAPTKGTRPSVGWGRLTWRSPVCTLKVQWQSDRASCVFSLWGWRGVGCRKQHMDLEDEGWGGGHVGEMERPRGVWR